MMTRMAKFSKVSFDQFMKDWCNTFNLVYDRRSCR